MSKPSFAAHALCDTHRERRPLREACALARTEEVHRARGVGPDAPEVILVDVLADLRRAVSRSSAPLAQGTRPE